MSNHLTLHLLIDTHDDDDHLLQAAYPQNQDPTAYHPSSSGASTSYTSAQQQHPGYDDNGGNYDHYSGHHHHASSQSPVIGSSSRAAVAAAAQPRSQYPNHSDYATNANSVNAPHHGHGIHPQYPPAASSSSSSALAALPILDHNPGATQATNGPAVDELIDEEPLYVNAKQYHRILKRRIARQRLEEIHKLSRERKVSKHYIALGPFALFLFFFSLPLSEDLIVDAALSLLDNDSHTFMNPVISTRYVVREVQEGVSSLKRRSLKWVDSRRY